MRINREGTRIILTTLLLAAVIAGAMYLVVRGTGISVWWFRVVAGIMLIDFLLVLWFFREPSRKHITDEDLVYSGADGKVVVVEEVEEDEFLMGRAVQVSVFMSIFNVHVNWYPVGGKVVYNRHHHGDYLVAWHPKSSEKNERTTTVVDTGREKILFRQIAGMIARRIVNYAGEGMEVEQNSKCGFIKFGSRVDIFLPPDAEILVRPGDRVTGSQTPIARLKR